MPLTAAFRCVKNGSQIELSRLLPAPIEKVWMALTKPARLADWMGVEWLGDDGDLREGSAFDYRFRNTDMESRGRILRLEAPWLLEHTWFDNVPPGAVVRWELKSEGDVCRLTLTHRFGAPDDAPRTAAGWTQLLEALAASLGEPGAPADWGKARWRAARDAYALAFPPEATRDGRRVEIDGAPALRFERRLAKAPETVWAALIEPESLARWMQADAVVEPRLGGRFDLGLDNGRVPTQGRITGWDASRVLEFTWTESQAAGHSLVRFELAAEEKGTRLTLTHIFKPSEDPIGLAEGWHWHLDALERTLEGETVTMDRERLEALRRIYAATL